MTLTAVTVRLRDEIAQKVQLRLCTRYRKLAFTAKPAKIVTAAIAREFAGFVSALAQGGASEPL
jgi:transposase